MGQKLRPVFYAVDRWQANYTVAVCDVCRQMLYHSRYNNALANCAVE